MNKNFSSLVSALVLAVVALVGGPAFATDFCSDNPNHVSCRPAQQPATGGSSQSDADARAIAAAQAAALAQNWNTMTQAQRQQAWASASNEVRQALQVTFGVTVTGGGASLTLGPITNNNSNQAGGAVVMTNVKSISVPAMQVQTGNLPSVIGNFAVDYGDCDQPYVYVLLSQKIVHKNTVTSNDVVDEHTGLYRLALDKYGEPARKPFRVLYINKKGDERVVQCEIFRSVISMENAAGTNGTTISFGNGSMAGGAGGSGGATRSFPTNKYLLPKTYRMRQCLMDGEWVNAEHLDGGKCPMPEADTSTSLTRSSGQPTEPPASKAEVDDLRAMLVMLQGELAKRPAATVGTGEAIIGYEPGRLVDAATTCEGKPIPPGKVCWRKPIKAPFINKFEGNPDLPVTGAKK